MPSGNSHLSTEQDSYLEKRDLLLRNVDADTIRRAWFTLSHLLLDEGAKVIDTGCDDGAVTYAMAAIAPKIKFIGLDKSKRQINKAREKFSLHNLEFVIGDATSEIFEPESIDAIINSYVLHEVYSGSRYNERIVSDTLRKQFNILKKGGVMFIRDYARPPPGEYVLMEMPDTDSTGDTLTELSEPDLLVWYAEHARPRSDSGTGGFFLEELPPRFPRTRLFRLPHKWAYEFIMRKDDRARWELGLPLEYTFFTPREFIKELGALGARVQYAGPHWEEEIIDKKFEGRFKLYADDGTPIGHPPTSYVVVSYKMQERKSLYIEERRPGLGEDSKLTISALRDDKTGRILDIVSRGMHVAEILPYRLDEEGRLKIFLHDGVARSIVNAVPRSGINLDGRSWSGHMIEPVAVNELNIADMHGLDVKNSARFARDYLGLIPREGAILEKGPDYYPSPDYIDERVYTYYLGVELPKTTPTPRNFLGHAERFQAKGVLREMDAQQILNAITVGMIPNGRLELQILALFAHLKIRAENWTAKHIMFQAGNITKQRSLHKLMKQYSLEQKRFHQVKGTAGILRSVHSTFVEEGQARGAVTGLSAQDIDFVVFDDKTINTAVVLPLCLSLKKDVHAGFYLENLPVPHLHEIGSPSITAPSFDIPRNLTTFQQIKKYIAEQFGVFPQMVFKIGESYFNHAALTPQRIYPFGVAVPPAFLEDPKIISMPLYQLMLQANKTRNPHFMTLVARSYRMLSEHVKFEANLRAAPMLRERFDHNKPQWSLPMTYHEAPGLASPEKKKPGLEKKNAAHDLAKIAPPKYQPFHGQAASTGQAPVKEKVVPSYAVADEIPQSPPEPDVVVKPLRPPVTPDKTPADFSTGLAAQGSLIDEFEQEFDEFLDDLIQHEKHDMRPEKW
jgi:SAM-dependent methyltransferase